MSLPPLLRHLNLAVALLAVLSFSVCPGRADEDRGFLTQGRLDKMVAALNNSQSRMQTLSELIQMCSQVIYPTSSNMMIYPDDRTRKIYERAAAVIQGCATKPTLRLALQSDDHNLQYWALRHIGPKDKDLIPLVQKLTIPGKSECANEALELLRFCKVDEAYIQKQVVISKDTDVLLHQIHDNKEFNRRLLALLDDSDLKIQENALDFVGFNYNMAEMYHKEFDLAIFDRVLGLSHSDLTKMRESSVAALVAVKKYGQSKVIVRLTELAGDKSPDVRWRVAAAMKGFPGDPSAEAVLATLRKDPSAIVRYFAAPAGDREKQRAILKEMSQSEDAETSSMARDLLRGLGSQP